MQVAGGTFLCFRIWGLEIVITINFEDFVVFEVGVLHKIVICINFKDFVVFVVKQSKLCFSLLWSILDISRSPGS